MVMIPIAALVVIWLILTIVLASNATMRVILAGATDDLVTPAAVGLVDIMEERSQSISYIEDPENDQLASDLETARESSDESLGPVVDDLMGFIDHAPGDSGENIEMLHSTFGDIEAIRTAVDDGSASRSDVFAYYNELIQHGADTFDIQAREGNTGDAVSPGFTATYMFRTVDELAQADAQVARAFANDELTVEDQQEFAQRMGAYESFLDASGPYLQGDGQAERFQELLDSPEYQELENLQQEIINREVETETTTDPVTLAPETVEDTSMPVDRADWETAYDSVMAELTELGADEARYTGELTQADANEAILLAVGGSLGVAAVTVSAFFLARRSARYLTNRMLTLRDDANDLAENRLPDVMQRLHRGERVDTQSAAHGLEVAEDEIGDVAKAFNTAQESAVKEAVQQAELRQGVNRVFLNIAHRSQTLVHRQLRLLDRMEREQEDPDQLTQLFKLDHLATRSRRNAENLLILGGEAPGRTWHRPMPLVDVLRGAISESGDYTRVKRERMARVHLNGPAVADVIHLVAELVDNATMFSPPHTQVRLSSEDVPHGVTIEIEDRGLGMTEGELTSANALLADPPEFDVMRLNEKMRLGLFVVSHLAHRHDISVHLRSSPYGGVQAIVLLPHQLISGDRTPLPASEDGERDGWELRGVVDRDPGNALESGASDGKPVLASVPPATENSPAGNGAAAPSGATDPGTSAGEPGEGSRSPLPTRPTNISAVPEPSAPPEEEAATSVEAGGGRPPLPKRRPQHNLAPQLASDPPAEATESPGGTPAGEGVFPDHDSGSAQDSSERLARLRQTMAAFQKGTDRGRRDGKQQTTETDKDTHRD